MMKSVKTCVFSAFVALIFSCDGGLTVPFVNFTVQTTTLSDADLEKLQSEEGALFRYSIPAFVTVDGKSDGETARITMKQKRNFRFLIECQPRAFLSFEKWTAEPAEAAKIENPTSPSTLILLTGDCVVTASFTRHNFLIGYQTDGARLVPNGIGDEELNLLYSDLLKMEEKGVPLGDYIYPAFDERGLLTANPDYPTWLSLLDFMASRSDFDGSGLDRDKNGVIDFASDGLNADALNSFFFGTYENNLYRGLYAGLLFFGDSVLTAAPGSSLRFENESAVSAAWNLSSGLSAAAGGGEGDSFVEVNASADGVVILSAVSDGQ